MSSHVKTHFPFKKGDLFEVKRFPIWWDVLSDHSNSAFRLFIGDFILVLEEPHDPTHEYKESYSGIFPPFGRVAKALVLSSGTQIRLITVKEREGLLELISQEEKCLF